MIQVFLTLLQYLATGFFGLLAMIFAVLAVLRWRAGRRTYPFTGIALVAGAIALFILSFDPFTAETTDRADTKEAFLQNFGFYPPSSVRDIKVKNIAIADAVGHYMTFTYEDWVFTDILAHDQPLLIAKANSAEFEEIVLQYQKDQNRPDWAVLPTGRTNMIYYKKDFLKHSYSEYYLWVDTLENRVHLHVGYFD